MDQTPRTPESPIQFKPINPGLGFHPFSEGMPYAPPAQMPPPPSKRPGAPMGSGLPHQAVPVRPRIQKPAHLTSPAPTLTPSAPLKIKFEEAPIFERYILDRILAFTVDLILNTSLLTALFVGFVAAIGVDWNQLFSPEIIVFEAAFVLFFHLSLLLIQELIFGTTLGKRMFGLKLAGHPVRIFLRAFLFPFSIALGGLGLITSLFDSKKRCLHDLLSGEQPVRD